MATQQEIRRDRLKNDYAQMCNIRGNIIQWVAVKGTPPIVEAYHLTVNVKTIIGPRPNYTNTVDLELHLPDNYPAVPPLITVSIGERPFHPNWYSVGRWCYGSWHVNEGLGEHVIRMIKTLQYDSGITNERSAANSDANSWYLQKRNWGLFPCDKQQLPDPTTAKGTSPKTGGKTFKILSQ